jgi:methionyl-tRNA synthetase
MLGSYFGGHVPAGDDPKDGGPLPDLAIDVARRLDEQMLQVSLSGALSTIWELVDTANKYLVEREPWAIAKDPDRRVELGEILYTAAETLRILAVLISPVMPGAAARLWEQLGIVSPLAEQRVPAAAVWGGLVPGSKTTKGDSLFPRIED